MMSTWFLCTPLKYVPVAKMFHDVWSHGRNNQLQAVFEKLTSCTIFCWVFFN